MIYLLSVAHFDGVRENHSAKTRPRNADVDTELWASGLESCAGIRAHRRFEGNQCASYLLDDVFADGGRHE